MPGGGDWLSIRADGVGELDVRVVLQTDDDALIYMHYPGVLYFPPQTKARIKAGEAVEDSAYYMRSTPRFETGDDRYDWLNRILSVGVGRRTESGVAYEVYEVL